MMSSSVCRRANLGEIRFRRKFSRMMMKIAEITFWNRERNVTNMEVYLTSVNPIQ